MVIRGYCPRMTAANLEPRAHEGVRYHVGGEGEPLLLVHGLGGSTANWCELLPALTERHRVLSVDLPGHAGSERLPRGATTAEFARPVASVLDAEGVEQAVVAGHSFGGLVALRLAERRPELVRALLLVSPAGISSSTRAAEVAIVAAATVRPGRYVEPLRHRWAGRAWYRRALFRPWFVADAVALTEQATHGLLSGQRTHTDTMTAGRALVADDPRLGLPALSCPVLVLWGARDAQLPPADAFDYARRLRAPLRLVAGCGHLVLVERPDAVLDALASLA